ncbi:hypothetical protein WEI85_40745 [Actinomycetes bacterium KLBMP 9797]
MSSGRVALIITGVLVAAAGLWFAFARWDTANKVATVGSALGAVAAIGVAVWTALRDARSRGSIVVSDTGPATADSGGAAITGVSGAAGAVAGSVSVRRTGDARTHGGGDAVTGAQLN